VGPAANLAHIILPVARAAGPFQAQVARFDPRTAGTPTPNLDSGSCVVVIHATGVEGGAEISYIAVHESPGGGYVQALNVRSPQQVITPSTPVLQAILESDGSLTPRR
jgi:hypothetical protein